MWGVRADVQGEIMTIFRKQENLLRQCINIQEIGTAERRHALSPPPSRLCGWQDEPTRRQRWSQEQSQAIAQVGEDSLWAQSREATARLRPDGAGDAGEVCGYWANSSSCRNIGVRASLSAPLWSRGWNHRRAMKDLTRRLDEAERPPHSTMISSARAIQISWLHASRTWQQD